MGKQYLTSESVDARRPDKVADRDPTRSWIPTQTKTNVLKEKFYGHTPTVASNFEDRHWKTLEVVSHYAFDRILDVGCGDGKFSLLLRDACQAKEVHGLEITSSGVELAKSNEVLALQLDVSKDNFPYPENFFDAVFACEVMSYLYDPDHFLKEAFKVLKSGGILVLTTPNLANIYNRLALFFGLQPFCIGTSLSKNFPRITGLSSDNTLDHLRVMTLGFLRQLLEINNYKLDRVIGSGAMISKRGLWGVLGICDSIVTIFPSFAYRTIIVSHK